MVLIRKRLALRDKPNVLAEVHISYPVDALALQKGEHRIREKWGNRERERDVMPKFGGGCERGVQFHEQGRYGRLTRAQVACLPRQNLC